MDTDKKTPDIRPKRPTLTGNHSSGDFAESETVRGFLEGESGSTGIQEDVSWSTESPDSSDDFLG